MAAPHAAFAGFPEEGLAFLRALKKNNKRGWFQPRKAIFEEHVKAPMVALVEAVNGELAKFASDYIVEPSKAIYRIYRDTRFSNNKTPYKTHIAASFWRHGMVKHAGAGFYFSVAPDEIEVAGGVYMPGPEELLALRTHIAKNADRFRRLVKAGGLVSVMGELQGESLSRVPKGFAADHPAADLIRMKQWLYYITDLDPALAKSRKIATEIVLRFRVMEPVVSFLNESLKARKRDVLSSEIALRR